MSLSRKWIMVSVFATSMATIGVFASEPDAKGLEFFEKSIRPVLVQHCFECHSGAQVKGGLRLDSRQGWMQGGDSGPAISVGKPDESLLIQAIRYGGDYEMPPKGKLPDSVILDLERWVSMGAPDPRVGSGAEKKQRVIDIELGRKHWAYQPIVSIRPPAVQDESWPHNGIDRFILARWESAGLRTSGDASREVLARRLYFDLLGLPPSVEALSDFVHDPSEDAYERLVDRLLTSPQFGERWGRHWLDVARFAESVTLRGFVLKEAWRYRDYVIDTFNSDSPYDEFIREQIAGDLLSAGSLPERQRRLIATTFLAMGNTNFEEQDKKQLEMDVIDEQLDVISKGILAQTITCARCHDHKFDPIPTRDYYALAGILRNTKALEHANVSKWVEAPLPLEPDQELKYQEYATAVAALKKKTDRAKQAVKLAAANSTTGGANVGQSSSNSAADAIVSAKELPGLVVDDSQAKKVGEWKASQFTKSYVGDGYVHDLDQGKGEKTLTFAPELPRDGQYEVRFAYTSSANRADKVPITVFSADGEKTIFVDEREPPAIDGRFVSLGQFRFERAGQSFAIVSNERTNGHVIADAVQFIPVESLEVAATAKQSRPSTNSPTAADMPTAELKRLEAELKKLESKAPYRPAAMTVLERKEISDTQVHVRGSVHNLGDAVPRGFLQVCTVAQPTAMPSTESGRRELAEWLTDSRQPLTPRVVANRLWYWLIGAGLVESVDNFGTTGEAPSHPELLDYLARELVDSGWSIKHVVREIVLSHTYRQACDNRETGNSVAAVNSASTSAESKQRSVDPENRLLTHMNRKRLDAECIRDAMLMVSGELRMEMGGPTFRADLTSDYGYQHTDARRGVYSPIFRNSLPEFFEAFDFADPSVVTGRRNVSTVAPQALLLMNHPFVTDQSKRAAAKLLAESWVDDGQRIDAAFRRALGRLPTDAERESTKSFLHSVIGSGGNDSVLTAWSQVFHAIFASIDFRYID